MFSEKWKCAPQKVAAQNHRKDPEKSADDIVDNEGAVRHLRRASDYRRKGANDWDEARDDDGLAAVLFVKGVRFLQVARLKEQRFRTLEKTRPHLRTCKVADGVAYHSRDED